jgi:Arc/MetJ-type ribon-helix-helix transcriptional regulator
MPSPSPDPSYHLLRVRVRKGIFLRLQQVAEQETQETGEYTTVSDIVRSAILDWISGHDADLMFSRSLDNQLFTPSGVAMKALDMLVSDQDNDELP